MPISIRIKRGVGGAPATLLRGELAFDEGNQKLYIGKGDSGADDANGLPIATSVVELTTPPSVLADLADISVGSGASDGDVLVYNISNDEWVAQALSIAWDDVTSKPASFTPSTHASSHHTGGGDAIAPEDIGAAAATHSHAWSDITSGVPSAFTPSAHKASHATGGTDALSPSDIGAAASSHTHSASDITSGLATVATTGAYSDLSGSPTLGTAAASATSDFAAASHSHAAADITSGTLDIARIPTGSTSSTVCIGDDARLTNNRDPNSHTHGNITNAGAIGSTSGLPIKTGTSGVLEAGAFGTSAGQFAEGNHSHAWDDITSKPSTFTPSAHSHTVTLEISGLIESPEAKTYVLSPAIPAAITITQFKAQTSAGTVDLAVHDDGTLVTDCSLADAGTTLASLASAISESVAAGSKLALVVSDLQSSPADLAFSVHYTVTSANNS
jgi:hypothetical protein